MRILGVTLEVSARQGMPLQVDGGAEQDVHSLAPGLLAEGTSDGFDQFDIPGRAQCDAHRKAGRSRPAAAIAANAVGSVTQLQGRDAQTGYCDAMPGIRARTEGDLFLEGESVEPVLQASAFSFQEFFQPQGVHGIPAKLPLPIRHSAGSSNSLAIICSRLWRRRISRTSPEFVISSSGASGKEL